MSEPIWLTLELVLAIHDSQLRKFGGPEGVRDQSALESALGRARNKWGNEDADLATLAAAYAFGIARNHAFVDGNKRTALIGFVTFLGLNGVEFLAAEAEAVVIIRDLAAGTVDESGLARWIKDNLPTK